MSNQATKNPNTKESTVTTSASETHEVKHETTLFAESIAHIGSFSVTNALITSSSAVLIIAILMLLVRMSLREIPGKIQNFFEALLEGALDLCDQVTNSRKISEKVFPLAFSVFLFILVNNWLGLLPLGGLGLIEKGAEGSAFIPFLRSGTADVNTTVALAIMAVLSANLFGIFSIGIWKTFNKYVNLSALGGIFLKVRKDPTVLVVAPVTFFVGVLELIGEFVKIASLSFRLFGNVFAGEVLLMAMSKILPYFLPIPFLFLEIFVGLIQAIIFSVLMLVYFTIAAQDHDSHDESHETTHAHVEGGSHA